MNILKVGNVLSEAMELIDKADQMTWQEATREFAGPLLSKAYKVLSGVHGKLNDELDKLPLKEWERLEDDDEWQNDEVPQ